MKQIEISDIKSDMIKLPDGSNLITKSMEKVMHDSMIPYAEYVILDRAIPRVEDGLKPVQRRILYSMYELGVTPDKSYRKSARIVGDCMGRYHPHGDSSIYDAMVRLAQDFSMSAPLVDGQGNYGNVDGDSAAAMRYTEAKLAPIALELLRDLDKDTVSWSRNFDDSTKEPNMLPGRFPNLLVNGSSGIAVGLATNIPSHNLTEVIDGVIAYIDEKSIKLSSMMKIIKGPDFPTGGYVITDNGNGGDGLVEAYETGRGRIYIRAKAHIEAGNNDRHNIVFTELPYQVNKADLLIKIANLKDEKKEQLAGIAEIVDESDKDGMRAVIKLRAGTDPNQVLNYLYKHTQLQVSYNINMVAIADGKPQLMGLLDIIAYYTAYQRDVVLRRSKFELAEAKDRAHILQGLVIAVTNIDEVVETIKNAESTTDARLKLRSRFELSERQAQAILDLRLARITKLEVTKLQKELAELEQRIVRLNEIINSKKEQMKVVKDELTEIKRAYKTARRSAIVRNAKDIVVDDETAEKPVENVIVGISADYKIKRIPVKNYNMSNRETVSRSNLSEVLIECVDTNTDCKVIFFTNLGNCYQCLAGELPETKYRDDGKDIKSIFKTCEIGEYPISAFAMDKANMPEGELLFFTRQGMVKRSSWQDYSLLKSVFQGFKSSKEYDELVAIKEADPKGEIFIVTNKGGCVRFDLSEVPVQGRVAGGVKAIQLDDTEYVICCCQCKQDGTILMITDKGYMKRLNCGDITKHGRACKSAKGTEFSSTTGEELAFASYVEGVHHYNVAVSDKATTLIVNTGSVSVESKNHKGKLPSGKKGSINVDLVLRYRKNPNKIYRPLQKRTKKSR